jgi:hypothetical protein
MVRMDPSGLRDIWPSLVAVPLTCKLLVAILIVWTTLPERVISKREIGPVLFTKVFVPSPTRKSRRFVAANCACAPVMIAPARATVVRIFFMVGYLMVLFGWLAPRGTTLRRKALKAAGRRTGRPKL